VLDLYRLSGLRPLIDENSANYYSFEGEATGDGVHLNNEGQMLIAQKIYRFIVKDLIPPPDGKDAAAAPD
jgi:lysophospholipase L1-like esterase